MTTLKSIPEELADCRRAFEESPASTWAWCLHHEVHVEPLTESWQNRINYIATGKPEAERALRFRNFRPVRVVLSASLNQAWAALDQARAALYQAGAALDQAGAACNPARAAFNQARAAFNQARAALDQAGAAYSQAWAAYDQAGAALNQAWAVCKPELPALHQLDWPDNSWNGTSIF